MHQSIIGGDSGRNWQALSISTISPSMFITRSWMLTSLVVPAKTTSAVATSPSLPLPLPLSLLAAPLPLLLLFLKYSSPLCHPAWRTPSIFAPSKPPPTLAQRIRRTRTQGSHAQTPPSSLTCVSNLRLLNASSYSDAMYKVYTHMAFTCPSPQDIG